MNHVTYEIVEHNGGWAYKVGEVFSETFPTHADAAEAAKRAAEDSFGELAAWVREAGGVDRGPEMRRQLEMRGLVS